MTDNPLSEAIRLIKAGKRPEAQLILEPFIQANPQSIQAWMWEAEIFLDDCDKIRVMEICLEHNPGHPQVLKALEILSARSGQAFTPPPAPTPAPTVSNYSQPRQITPAYMPAPHAPTPTTVAPPVEMPSHQKQTPKPAIRRKHPDWPTIEGVVQVSEIRAVRTGYTPLYMVDLTAMYVVNNKDYTVKYPRGKARVTPDDAEILVSNYPPGKNVIVSYHPKNPRRAWVDEWDDRSLQAFKDRPEVRNQLGHRYKSRIWSGCGFLIAGIGLTVAGTMFLSSMSRGVYVAFTGLIFYGLVAMISGIFGWLWNMD